VPYLHIDIDQILRLLSWLLKLSLLAQTSCWSWSMAISICLRMTQTNQRYSKGL